MRNNTEPFASGHLSVGDGNEIYWETSGSPKGQPALFLHGGPGSGISGGYRKHFDSEKFLIVSFEQRGCGQSRPNVSDPSVNLMNNTTQNLISDIEKLRIHLNVDKWLLLGISWGTTLALAYSQAHPDKVLAIVLAAVTTTTSSEVKWITEDMRRLFPREWERFAGAVEPKPGERLIDAYYRQITSHDLKIREQASKAWCVWEDVHVSLDPHYEPNPRFQDLTFSLPFSILTIHYWKHSAFLEDTAILANMNRIAHIPGVLIHGRLDISSPLDTAWKLHQAWPGSELVIVDNEGHGGKSMFKAITGAIRPHEKKELEISYAPLTEKHFPLIHKWFNLPHVQAHYSLRDWTIQEVRQKLTPYIQEVEGMKCYVVSVEGKPIGYVQSYPVKFHPWEDQDLSESVIQEAAGIDLFIGEQEFVCKGFGFQILNSFLERHIWPSYRYCLADPDIRNEISIRLFKKLGFREHKRIETQDALNRPVTLQLVIKENVSKSIVSSCKLC